LRFEIYQGGQTPRLCVGYGSISKKQKKTVVGAESSGRDLIGSETFVLRTGYANTLPIYNLEMLPRILL